MAELGKAPLTYKSTDNVVECGHCHARLPASAAGASVTGHYTGPVLDRVVVATSRKTLHDCDASAGEEF